MNAWLQISSGRGPDECCLAVAELLPVFVAEAKATGVETDLLEAVEGPKPRTYRSVLLSLEGEGLPAFLASWQGTVQWSQPSPYRPHHGRKNWFVNVVAYRAPGPADQLREADIQYEAIRASGPGGQHVNKTSSAIRATHLPTGTVATAQEERSQLMNKKLAAARLAQLLRDRHTQSRRSLEQQVWHQHNCLERGNAIRSYSGSPPKRVLK